MDNDQTESSPVVNRVAIPLQLLEAQDTTLAHAQIQKALRGRKEFNKALLFINRALLGLIVAAALYLLYQAISGLTAQPLQPVKPVETGPYHILKPSDLMGDELASLQQMVSQRSLFEPVPLQGAAHDAAAETTRSELYAKLRILGVLIDQPSKAILEIVPSGQTVFAQEGDVLEGATLKKISENKLLFIYNGTEVELSR